jgi:hypothetical protein
MSLEFIEESEDGLTCSLKAWGPDVQAVELAITGHALPPVVKVERHRLSGGKTFSWMKGPDKQAVQTWARNRRGSRYTVRSNSNRPAPAWVETGPTGSEPKPAA